MLLLLVGPCPRIAGGDATFRLAVETVKIKQGFAGQTALRGPQQDHFRHTATRRGQVMDDG